MADRPVRKGPRTGAGPRLAVIEGFAGRRSAIPFALLVLGVLGIGLVALLMLNTAMDENSVKTAQAQQRQAALTDREQQLAQQLAGLSAPAALASQAAALGLVPNPQPAFLNPTTGAVLGTASPAPTPSPSPSPSLTPSQTPSGTQSGGPGSTTPSGPASGSPSTSTSASGAHPTANSSGSPR
jgi:Tfp pilus assembly protein PilX